jgi:hypothetical protein
MSEIKYIYIYMEYISTYPHSEIRKILQSKLYDKGAVS